MTLLTELLSKGLASAKRMNMNSRGCQPTGNTFYDNDPEGVAQN